jgi:DNA polymerase
MPEPAQQLAELVAKVRVWAQTHADPSARVRLARPLELARLPAAVTDILATGVSGRGGERPSPPWADSLEAFQRQIAECRLCHLGGRRRHLVFGEGSATASLVLVGGAPSGEEDLGGRPFVGAVGELLDRILAAMGFKRADVYLCNVLKCRPASEADAAAASVCRPFLDHQLELIRPKVVVALGAFATRVLLDDERPLAELRGRWAERRGLPVLPTHHPAELLRDPGLKRRVWDDMKLVLRHLQTEGRP